MTFVLGLTGSIGMGKSATADLFRDVGVPVYDADAAVHALYAGEAAPLVEAAFPGAVRAGIVDRALLSEIVLSDPAALKRLEAIIHPLVRREQRAFLARARARGDRLAVLDIPLLLEGDGSADCDAIAVVSAPATVQRSRVMARPGMTPSRFEAIVARQMPDARKRAHAHVVIDTARGFEAARRQVRDIQRMFAACPGRRHGRRESEAAGLS